MFVSSLGLFSFKSKLKENDRETGQKVKFEKKENIEDKEWKKEGSNRFRI